MRMPTASESLTTSIKNAGRSFDDAERIKLSLEISEVLVYLLENKSLRDEMYQSGEIWPTLSEVPWDAPSDCWKAYVRGKSIVIHSMNENGVVSKDSVMIMKFPAFFEIERAIARAKRNFMKSVA